MYCNIIYNVLLWHATELSEPRQFISLQIYNNILHIILRNNRIHNDAGIPLTYTRMKIQFKNVNGKLKNSDGTRHYEIGNKTHATIAGQILLTDPEEFS